MNPIRDKYGGGCRRGEGKKGTYNTCDQCMTKGYHSPPKNKDILD